MRISFRKTTVSLALAAAVATVAFAAPGPLYAVRTAAVWARGGPPPSMASEMAGIPSVTSPARATSAITATNRYVTAPGDLPQIHITGTGSTAPGYIFLSTMWSAGGSYLLIVDDLGQPVYYQSMGVGHPGVDFKKQPDGTLTWFDILSGQHRAMDQAYALTNTWAMSGFATTDLHELRVLTNGNALMMSYNEVPFDLSAVGGMANEIVVDIVGQDQDPRKNPVFTLSGLALLPVTPSYESVIGPVALAYHGNAIEQDTDGNLLLSNRHTAQIVKIDRATGGVLWKLGGKDNDFTFVNDTGFSYQHDIRRLENGHITLFDNGNPRDDFPRPTPYSRAVEYEIDEVTKVITRVWEYRSDPDIYGFFMGNVQRLPNGNTFIGWGGPATIGSAVTPGGEVALEMRIDQWIYGYNYRWFRFPWVGRPSTLPALVSRGDALYFSWNGATEISSYRVEGSATFTGSFSTIDTPIRAGFETSSTLGLSAAGMCYFRVMPIDNAAADTRYSATVYAPVDPACPPAVSAFIPLVSRCRPAGG